MGRYDFEIQEIKERIANSDNVVFFGGAGVSTDSGIPDFRGSQGLYQPDETNDSPQDKEYLMSNICLHREPDKFFDFYHNHIAHPYAQPNEAHEILAQMEQDGVLRAIITQNIDNLHQKAGSKQVFELHGTCDRWYCMKCGKKYTKSEIDATTGVPHCSHCNGIIRPDITLYGEGLDAAVFDDAAELIAEAEILIVGGTSLTVHPAASLIPEYQGDCLVIINQTPTPYDGIADYVIQDSLSDVLREIYSEMDEY